MIMNTDREAIALAVKTVVRVKPEHCRIVRIRNTLHLGEIQISAALLNEVRANPGRFEIVSGPAPLAFDSNDTLAPLRRTPEAAAA
jgi:hypothetical protein